jgi:hypothetical protein
MGQKPVGYSDATSRANIAHCTERRRSSGIASAIARRGERSRRAKDHSTANTSGENRKGTDLGPPDSSDKGPVDEGVLTERRGYVAPLERMRQELAHVARLG